MTRREWERKLRGARWRLQDTVRARRMWTAVIILTMLLLFLLAFLGVTMDPLWFALLAPALLAGVPWLGWVVSEEEPWYSVIRAQRDIVRIMDDYAYAELRGEVTE